MPNVKHRIFTTLSFPRLMAKGQRSVRHVSSHLLADQKVESSGQPVEDLPTRAGH